MSTINITIANLVATPEAGDPLVRDNSGYEILFTFDTPWDAYPLKSAVFVWNEDFRTVRKTVPFTGNTVSIPVITGGSAVYVGVTAGDLQTTTPARIPCRNSILSLPGSDPELASGDAVSRITAALTGMLDEKLDVSGHAVNKLLGTDASGNVVTTQRGGADASAYDYALDGGFTGTEEEFAAKMAAEYAPADHTHTGVYLTQEQIQELLAGYQPAGEYLTEEVLSQYQPAGDYVTEDALTDALADCLTEAPVTSVNGKTGAVTLAAADVGALPTGGGSVGDLTLSGSLILTEGVNLFTEQPDDYPDNAIYWIMAEEA